MLNFVKTLINSNIRISTSEIIDLYKVLSINDNYTQETFHDALQTTLIKNYDDIETFNHIYELYFALYEVPKNFNFDSLMDLFDTNELDFNDKQQLQDEARKLSQEVDYQQNQDSLQQSINDMLTQKNYDYLAKQSDSQNSLNTLKQMIKQNVINNYITEHPDQLEEVISDLYPDTSYIEDKDFKDFTFGEVELAINTLTKLSKQLNNIYARKKIKANKGKINIKKTIKNTIQQNPKINYKKPKKDKNDLILLLDISGSMKEYIKYILALVLNSTIVFDSLKVFVFMGKVQEVKLNLLYDKDINVFFDKLSKYINDIYRDSILGFGTDYANTFFMLKNKKIYSKKTYMLIIGDGINTKEEVGLDDLIEIKKKVKSVYMLNPLKQEEWKDPYHDLIKTFECSNFKQLNKIIRSII